jgi:hypothetical protein
VTLGHLVILDPARDVGFDPGEVATVAALRMMADEDRLAEGNAVADRPCGGEPLVALALAAGGPFAALFQASLQAFAAVHRPFSSRLLSASAAACRWWSKSLQTAGEHGACMLHSPASLTRTRHRQDFAAITVFFMLCPSLLSLPGFVPGRSAVRWRAGQRTGAAA